MKKSNAEGNIDIIIYKSFFSHKIDGIFVDVGAGRPDYLSISALYRSIGWQVIAIEPNPLFSKIYKKLNYQIIECACGNTNKDNVDFYVVNSHKAPYFNGHVTYESFSSLGIKKNYEKMWMEKYKTKLDIKKIKVNVRTLTSILENIEMNNTIDILSIDVEGWELNVLNGFDFTKYHPKVVIVENINNDSNYLAYMKEKNYFLWKHIEPNDIYIPLNIKNIIRYVKKNTF